MSKSANGIACWDDLSATQFTKGTGTQCPRKQDITGAIKSGYSVSIPSSYLNNQLVRYSDITVTATDTSWYVNVPIKITHEGAAGGTVPHAMDVGMKVTLNDYNGSRYVAVATFLLADDGYANGYVDVSSSYYGGSNFHNWSSTTNRDCKVKISGYDRATYWSNNRITIELSFLRYTDHPGDGTEDDWPPTPDSYSPSLSSFSLSGNTYTCSRYTFDW